MVREAPNLPAAPMLDQLSLRRYQRAAIHKMRAYIHAFRRGETARAGLVHMATGAGKTGVIATLARCIPEVAAVLVLAPRVALRNQLALQIDHRFFDGMERRPKVLPKLVAKLEGGVPAIGPEALDGRVLVSTIQLVDGMRRAAHGARARDRKRTAFFRLLLERIQLLLVDEGHYEPALSWSETLREFKVPKILFTATPYRNDLKPFDIDTHFRTSFGYRAARDKCFVRDVAVIEMPEPKEPRAFINDVLAFYDDSVAPQWRDARVIIRCDKEESIRQMAELLSQETRRFVAIHENFKDRGGELWERRTVPDREAEPWWYGEEGPLFWIHQFKLLEGIDDHRFRLLALYEPLRNTRAFVQQVGRIIRNPAHPRRETAFVLDHSRGRHRRRWASFLKYDADAGAVAKASPNEDFLKTVLEAHPDPAYIDGAFRDRFSFKAVVPESEILVPLTTSLLQKGEGFRLARLGEAVEERLRQDDRVFDRYDLSACRTILFIYFSFDNAPFLDSTYFIQCSPGLILIRDLPKLVAFYDSGGGSPLGLPGLGKAARPEHLRRLFSARRGSKLIEAAMKNSQLGHRAIRMRSLTAASVEETIPALDDYAQVLTRVAGYSVEDSVVPATTSGRATDQRRRRRRYVGFRHGRVAESGERVDLATYLRWLEDVADVVTGDRPRLSTFSRYSGETREVADPTPRNILLDVFEVMDSFKTLGNKEREIPKNARMEIEDLCQDVIVEVEEETKGTRYVFSVTANGHECKVEVRYDPERSRYKLRSPDLDKMYHQPRSEGGTSLISYLNEEQSFRVLPVSPNRIYMEGAFYEPVVAVGPRFNRDSYHVGKVLHPVPRLETIGTEKGNACLPDESDWDPDSLFGLVSRFGGDAPELRRFLRRPDILVCDDMGTEVADFVMADAERRCVVFIHAKCEEDGCAPYSASRISQVCAQAIKNIRYLSMFNDLQPKNLPRWEEPWTDTAHVEGRVRSRIRVRPNRRSRAVDIWRILHERISDPLTTREVWLLLGRTLSKRRLEQELSRPTAAPEAVQAVTLLHGTLAAVGSIDAKLRVFCYP